MTDHLDPATLATVPGTLRYLELLKACLTRELFPEEEFQEILPRTEEVWNRLQENGWKLVQPVTDRDARREGRDVPPHAETMVGAARLDNVQDLVTRIVLDEVPGDLVETGVWRGGTIVLMRAVLEALGDAHRTVWACDSFQGLPEPDVERYPADAELLIDDTTNKTLMDLVLAIPVEQVRANIERYGLFDPDRVRFVEGWFRDTLADAPIEQIALLRLDGDLYESTMDALVHLEPRVVPGGYVVIDDYGCFEACRAACTDYRARQGITDPIVEIDWTGVWWRRSPR